MSDLYRRDIFFHFFLHNFSEHRGKMLFLTNLLFPAPPVPHRCHHDRPRPLPRDLIAPADLEARASPRPTQPHLVLVGQVRLAHDVDGVAEGEEADHAAEDAGDEGGGAVDEVEAGLLDGDGHGADGDVREGDEEGGQ